MPSLTMRCASLALLFSVLGATPLQAQKQYWATTMYSSAPLLNGGIVRLDSAAMNPEVVLAFDTSFATSLGKPAPYAGLLQASNGLIYYMTEQNNYPYHTRIIALDPVTDSAWTAVELGTAAFPWKGQRYNSSMIEGEPGFLIDVTKGSQSSEPVFRFNITTNALSVITTIPSAINENGYPVHPTLLGTLSKASDGKIYAGESPWSLSLGKFAVVDPVNQSYNTLFTSTGVAWSGWYFNGDKVQVGSKLYASTRWGGATEGILPGEPGLGTIDAYDMTTGTYQKLLDLDSSAFWPHQGFVLGSNGLLFSEAQSEPLAGNPSPGCLFAYDPANNTLSIKVNYGASPLGFQVTGTFFGPGILAASNGKIYGSFRNGVFEYDPLVDSLRLRTPLQFVIGGVAYSYGLNSPLIEICRKPNYKPTATTAFQVCAGGHFAYDLHNVNATSVVWRRNGVVVPSQTDQRLEFAPITEGDEGVWACTLTNECGITEPPPITITVNAGAFTTSTITGDTLLCGVGDSALLTGNNGGTWSTGATSATLAVTQPGTYFVSNQSACGGSMSNLVHVSHLDSALVPPTVFSENWQAGIYGTRYICPGATGLTLTGNTAGPWGVYTPGTWNTGDTGPSITVQDTGFYFVTVANACNADTTQVVHAVYPAEPPLPQLAFTDASGLPADNLLCTGDSVTVSVSNVPNVFALYYWTLPDGSYISFENSIVASLPGTYTVHGNGGCQNTPVPFVIEVDDTPPQVVPVIQPDQDFLTGCELDTAFLSSSNPNSYWAWYTGPGMLHTDTTELLQVDWNVDLYSLYVYNGCGNSEPDYIQMTGTSVPDVSYTESTALACINYAAFPLSPGTPTGGTYSGTGVVGNTFDPAIAGSGTHAITYSYGSGNCTGQAADSITVDLCAGVTELDSESENLIDPNPNKGTFQVHLPRELEEGWLQLYDASGKRVGNTTRLAPGLNTINRNALAPGVYQVRLEIDGKVENRSVVIISH